MAFWSALAEDSGRTVDCVLPPGPVPVRAAREDLAAALDALLENVFTHTPDGTALRVTVGPGRGWRRWSRTPGPVSRHQSERAGGGSTGLGLDIARRTAQAAGGSLRTPPARSAAPWSS